MTSIGKWCSFGLIAGALLLGGVAPSRAQEAAPTTPPRNEGKTQTIDLKPVDTPTDFTPLAKAMQGIGRTTTFFYEGDIEIKGVGKGITFSARERVRFTAKRPGKANADVLVTLGEASAGKHYVTLSDGENVYVQRPGTRQYSVTKFDATELTKNLTGLGILGALYFNPDLLNGIGMITPENAEQFVTLLKKENIELSGGSETIDGVPTPVYTMILAKQNMTFRFYVDAKRSALRRVEVTARDKGIEFTMSETILRQNPTPMIPKGLFKFVLAPGLTKTERVTVDLL